MGPNSRLLGGVCGDKDQWAVISKKSGQGVSRGQKNYVADERVIRHVPMGWPEKLEQAKTCRTVDVERCDTSI